jgi:undecaprenyl-diphosphatase
LAVIAALLMAFARVYIGAHYPADVAAGLLVGAVVAVIVYLATRTLLSRLVTAMNQTRLRPLVAAAPATT